jgi:radical SAM protein with 4Fe4S-binding SPASM domain
MKTPDNQFTFIQRRQEFERRYFEQLKDSDVIKSITVVDVNTTELCNRTCVFCPRHDPEVFPNRHLHMTGDGATIIAKKLQTIDYFGTIAISGFGENSLNPNILEVIQAFRDHCPKSFIEMNTNGDPLTAKKVQGLLDHGLDCLNINLYDGPEQMEKFNEMLKDIPTERYKYRAHWKTEDYGIIYNNRSGVVKWFKRDELKDVKHSPCYYPFYKMFVDWNGDVLFCANDWGRTRVVGNLLQQSVDEVWMGREMRKIRLKLTKGDRNFKPCMTCSVNGTLVGQQSHDILMEYYYENNRHRR